MLKSTCREIFLSGCRLSALFARFFGSCNKVFCRITGFNIFAKSKYAFTLAEVLITIGIIGVVAAFTIPTLMSNMQKTKMESQIKKTYSTLQNAFKYLENDDILFGEVANSSEEIKTWLDQSFLKHLTYSRVCVNEEGCWHKKNVIKLLDGTEPKYNTNNQGWGSGVVTIELNNGAYLDFDVYSSSEESSDTFGVTTIANDLIVAFDVNGKDRPNVFGKDIYVLVWTSRGFLPAGSDKTEAAIKNNCISGNGYYCLAMLKNNNWVIDNRVWKR